MAAREIRKLILVGLMISGMQSAALDPETRVPISIFDLVHAKAKSAGLDRRYVERVIALLNENQDRLLSCLGENESAALDLDLVIQPSGAAVVKSTASTEPAAECAAHVLAALVYPEHTFKGGVEIAVPLKLSRRTL